MWLFFLIKKKFDMNPPRVYMCSPSWTPPPTSLPPTPLGHPSAPAPNTLSHASNLDWWFISHMIIYMFQCHSLNSSHPHPLPQSPKGCSIHLCLFSCDFFKKIYFLDIVFLLWHSPLTYSCLSFAFLWISNYLIHFLFGFMNSSCIKSLNSLL